MLVFLGIISYVYTPPPHPHKKKNIFIYLPEREYLTNVSFYNINNQPVNFDKNLPGAIFEE